MSEIEEVKVDKPTTLDFFIGLKEAPARWYPKEEDRIAFSKIRETYTSAYRTLTEGHHPGLRYEDIVAHLMMQVMAYREPEDLVALVKTARQYANQAMKKVCRNCIHSMKSERQFIGTSLLYTAKGIGSESSSKFVENINASECADKCEECRVGRTIMVANTMETLVWGFKEIDKLRGFAVRWKNRWYKTHKKLKKQKWLTKQSKAVATGVISAKITLEKQNRELREALKENVLAMPEGVGKVVFDEFAKLEENLDPEAIEKIHKAIEKVAEGQQIITGSIEKVLSDEELREAKFLADLEKEDVCENMDPDQRQDIEDAVSGHPDSRFPYLMGLDPAKDKPLVPEMREEHPLKEVRKFNKEVDEAEFRRKYPNLAKYDDQEQKKEDVLLHSEPTEDDLLDNIEPENMTQEQTKRAKELRDNANSE